MAVASALSPLRPATLFVGPTRPLTTIGAALAVAAPGDLILVDAATYPAFTVSFPVTIAPTSSSYTVAMGTSAPAITVSMTSGTVVIDGASITFATAGAPAVLVSACPGDVRLLNLNVDAAANLVGTSARAAIELENSSAVVLEAVTVAGASARNGSTTQPDGTNDGLSALRCLDTQVLLRDCTLRGYDAPSGGGFAGDAVRAVLTGAFNPASCMMRSSTTVASYVGGNGGAGRGGNCVHQIGSQLFVTQFCGTTSFAPGTGATLAGGYFAINNDGGIIAPGVGRMVPACTDVHQWPVVAPMVAAPGTTFTVNVFDNYPGGPCMLFTSFGSMHLPVVSGINGHVFLNLATATAVGTGTTNATFQISVPANPALAGLALAFQAIVTSGSFPSTTGTSEARFVSIR